MHASGEVDATGDIAPLVAPSYLQGAAVTLIKLREVEGLQNHVAELGK